MTEINSADIRIARDLKNAGTDAPQITIQTSDSSDAQITATVLTAVDAQLENAIELLGHLVAIPSMGGTDAEAEIQQVLA